jgi:hypothetical protein
MNLAYFKPLLSFAAGVFFISCLQQHPAPMLAGDNTCKGGETSPIY